ncbi:helix-turn-helix domain-containing protein [Bathymodiolus septemdierum thioautotrophic gill symbiont]|uniref:XRE family transcriptional regulator n=1 Tax=endosymbiont of Bathymodiolus septemdierum str. Myojin knoll TaxID=1303921 RepID=A0A0P0UT61_9GAMM|nr:helix-turn-helix transcriptional regulator [Bathymodiolus septemdierum thioautotrophic gill symbiont]BAS68396.1 XRE family transcriptional regulator [endosymbiont of Bathymodiolus septemdierum str. Myojin knoll]
MPFLILKAQKPIANMPTELVTIGDHIRAKRLKSTEPLKETASKIGVNQWTLMNWEKHRTKNIPAKYYPKIMEYLTYCPLIQDAEIKNTPKTLGQKIKLHRLHQGLNQKKFAKLLKVDPTTVKFWESGERKPSIKTVQKLIKIMGIFDFQKF